MYYHCTIPAGWNDRDDKGAVLPLLAGRSPQAKTGTVPARIGENGWGSIASESEQVNGALSSV
jgi:hypothetical protein